MRPRSAAIVLLAASLLPLAATGRDLRLQPAEWSLYGGPAPLLVAPRRPTGAGDLDADGLPELLAGDPFEALAFRSGGMDVRRLRPPVATPARSVRIVLAEDLDGDGRDDAVVGDAGGGTYGVDQGRVYVVPGPLCFPGYLDPAGTPGEVWTLAGDGEFDELGAVGLLAADFDGDRVKDLLIHAVCCDPVILERSRIYGIRGPFPPGGSLELARTPPAFRWTSASDLASRVGAGDMDGDGRADLAVAIAGGWQVFLGSRLAGDLGAPDLEVLPIGGEALAIGDVNGDGIEDLLMGYEGGSGPGGSRGGGTGEVHVVFGKAGLGGVVDLDAGEGDLVIYGPACCERFGSEVAVGDWTGDGVTDLAVGAPDADGPNGAASGAVYVVAGGSGLSGTLDLALSPPELVIQGAGPGDRLGQGRWMESSILVGDLSGDGVPDIAVTGDGRGAADDLAGRLPEIHVVEGLPTGPFRFFHSIGDAAALAQEATGVTSPLDGSPGWVGDGALHFFRIEGPPGSRPAISVTRLRGSRTVRLSWMDGAPPSVPPAAATSEVRVAERCVAADGFSAARLTVIPRDGSGETLGAGLDVRPANPAAWAPGVPVGGFRDLGDGRYSVDVVAAAPGTSRPEIEVEGVPLPPGPAVEFSGSAPTLALTARPDPPSAGVPAELRAAIAGGAPPYTLLWDFGDGTGGASGETVLHTYRSPGTYPVVLRVEDATGCAVQAPLFLSVGP